MHRVQNHTPASFASTQLAGQKRQRNRDPVSCQPCRARKVACDREQPCGSCIKHKIPEKCNFNKSDEPNGSDQNNDTLNSFEPLHRTATQNVTTKSSGLDSRLDRVERAIELLTSRLDASAPGTYQPAAVQGSNVPANAQAEAISDDESTNPYASGSLAAKDPEKVLFIGQSGWTMLHIDLPVIWSSRSTFSKQWSAYIELEQIFGRTHHATLLQMVPTDLHPLSLDQDLASLVPEQSVCNILVERFFLTFNTTHPIVDAQDFTMDMIEFFAGEHKSRIWIVFFLGVLALGFQLPVIAFPKNVRITDGQARGRALMSTVKTVLLTTNLSTHRVRISILQTIMLVILSEKLALDWTDGADSVSGLLGLATRLAFTMGLHRKSTMAPVMAPELANRRRKVFITLTFIDIEHCIQSGMPFILRSSDYDSLSDESCLQFLSPYQRMIVKCLPYWADTVQALHSDRSTRPTEKNLDSLTELIDECKSLAISRPDSGQNLGSVSLAIQESLLETINHRLLLVLNICRLDLENTESCAQIVQTILNSAVSTLDVQANISVVLDNLPRAAFNAWTHFVTSLLRCSCSYALQCILNVLRRTVSEDRRIRITFPSGVSTSLLYNKIQNFLHFLEGAFPISIEIVKEHMIWNAYYASVVSRLEICQELGHESFSMTSSESVAVVKAMQDAMDKSSEKARAAISVAMAEDDPPPALVAAIERQKAAIAQQQESQSNGPADSAQGIWRPLDQTLLEEVPLDAWTKETDALLKDLDLQWPWQSSIWEDTNLGLQSGCGIRFDE